MLAFCRVATEEDRRSTCPPPDRLADKARAHMARSAAHTCRRHAVSLHSRGMRRAALLLSWPEGRARLRARPHCFFTPQLNTLNTLKITDIMMKSKTSIKTLAARLGVTLVLTVLTTATAWAFKT